MQVPDFGNSKRLLNSTDENVGVSLDSIDVTRDILNLNFILKSEFQPSDIEYSLQLKKWDEEKIGI